MGLKLHYSTLDINEGLAAAVRKAMSNVAVETVCGVVFCGTSEVEYHALLDELKAEVATIIGRKAPVTLIPQYLLPNGGLAIEIYCLEGATDIRTEELEGVCYGLICNDEESMLFVEGVPSSDFSASVRHQSAEVFGKLDTILSKHGFAVDDIVRQWNYIGDIVGQREGKQNYQEFNDARSEYYAKGKWQNGYPAATGIGSVEGIVVGAIAFKSNTSKAVYPIDNPLQVAAHVYSKNVLIDNAADAVKSTPKFERAKLIETARGACCFVSGTAAIRGEESVDAHSVELQTVRTIENIEYLVSNENLVRHGCRPCELKYVFLQVFIKNREDYDEVRRVVEAAYPCVTTIYTVADVCRSELLVEIEGILIS